MIKLCMQCVMNNYTVRQLYTLTVINPFAKTCLDTQLHRK